MSIIVTLDLSINRITRAEYKEIDNWLVENIDEVEKPSVNYRDISILGLYELEFDNSEDATIFVIKFSNAVRSVYHN